MKIYLYKILLILILFNVYGCFSGKVLKTPTQEKNPESQTDQISLSTDQSIGVPFSYAVANSNFVLPTQINVKNNTTWVMTFSQEIVTSTLTSNNVYVTDKSGTKFPTNLTIFTGRSFSISPAKLYSSGEKYTLNILTKNIKIKSTNAFFSYNTYMDFTIAQASDSTPPAFVSPYPLISAFGENYFTAQIKLNENGKVFYVVLPNNAASPSASQIKNGKNAAGTQATSGTTNISKDTLIEIMQSGLSANTDYDIYMTAEDTAGNIQSTIKKFDLKTAAAAVKPPTTTTSSAAIKPPSTTTSSAAVSTSTSFIYNNITYSGKIKTTDTSSPKVVADSGVIISEPTVKKFDADAFFIIRGSNSYSGADKYSVAYVTKKSTGESTSYWLNGNFEKKIWMSFGQGMYTVTVNKIKVVSNNLNFTGDINSWMDYGPLYSFEVNNTRNEDGKFFYPSDAIQSDDPAILSKALSLTSGFSVTGDKIKAIHNFVVSYLYYDDASLVSGQRKKQDALSTLNNKTGVCEGYTSLMNALLRSIGIKAKCIGGNVSGGAHAWSNVYKDSTWYFIDSTWDDPKPYDKLPNSIYYTYYMLTSMTGIRNDHTPTSDRPSRALELSDSNINWNGYPKGIY